MHNCTVGNSGFQLRVSLKTKTKVITLADHKGRRQSIIFDTQETSALKRTQCHIIIGSVQHLQELGILPARSHIGLILLVFAACATFDAYIPYNQLDWVNPYRKPLLFSNGTRQSSSTSSDYGVEQNVLTRGGLGHDVNINLQQIDVNKPH